MQKYRFIESVVLTATYCEVGDQLALDAEEDGSKKRSESIEVSGFLVVEGGSLPELNR